VWKEILQQLHDKDYEAADCPDKEKYNAICQAAQVGLKREIDNLNTTILC
jgi:hypothetical protein